MQHKNIFSEFLQYFYVNTNNADLHSAAIRMVVILSKSGRVNRDNIQKSSICWMQRRTINFCFSLEYVFSVKDSVPACKCLAWLCERLELS